MHGKGSRVRFLPLPPETIRVLQCYLKTERPLTNAPQLFVSLKAPARGAAMTPAGLRSLFRHHRTLSGVPPANPHRFRHTFGSDMIRAGVSLPALQPRWGTPISRPPCFTFNSRRRTFSPSTPAPSRRSPNWRSRRCLRTLPHPREEALRARVRLLATTLGPATVRQYEHTVRHYDISARQFPRSAHQRRRDPTCLVCWNVYGLAA